MYTQICYIAHHDLHCYIIDQSCNTTTVLSIETESIEKSITETSGKTCAIKHCLDTNYGIGMGTVTHKLIDVADKQMLNGVTGKRIPRFYTLLTFRAHCIRMTTWLFCEGTLFREILVALKMFLWTGTTLGVHLTAITLM